MGTSTTSESKSVSLYFRNGSSDKEYHAYLTASPDGDGYVVTFQYGRRGSTLTTGTKTQSPVAYDKAVVIFDKLVASKMAKGYTPGEDGTPYQGDATRQASGLLPQLLTVADDAEAARLVENPEWVMQEKFDGRRMLLRKNGDTVEAINKLGLFVAVSNVIAGAVSAIPGDVVLDGEVIGDRYYAFDLLSRGGDDLSVRGYRDRYAALTEVHADAGAALALAASWLDSADKAAQLDALRNRNAEGVVFKHLDAPYTAGRPNSGGPQRKFKFVETCSARVTAVNDKRSVSVSLIDAEGAFQPVGNVTIPPNHEVPTVGAVVEVRYLYALPGGSLYQPVYLGVRDDIEAQECVITQLKLKGFDS